MVKFEHTEKKRTVSWHRYEKSAAYGYITAYDFTGLGSNITFSVEEGYENEAGRPVTKSVMVTLDADKARQLANMILKSVGDA